MSPSALAVHLDFGRLVAEEPFSLYGEQLLLGGFSAWPASYQRRFPGFRTWHGVNALKAALRRLLGASDECPLHLASRSAMLMRAAARAMFRRCRRVLTTDLTWPAYQEILGREARVEGGRVIGLPMRRAILRHHFSTGEVIERITAAVRDHHCDGLFLPVVDHLGIRLPIVETIERIKRMADLQFVLVDAAQAFCHLPLTEVLPHCDVLLAGCHKWFGAYHPLGIACCGRGCHEAKLEINRERGIGALPRDPLLQFTEQLESGSLAKYTETVGLLPLFTCAGATADAMGGGGNVATTLRRQLEDADRLASMALDANWNVLRPPEPMRSGVLLLQPRQRELGAAGGQAVRESLSEAGLLATVYDDGLVRLSFPKHGIDESEWRRIGRALRSRSAALAEAGVTRETLPNAATAPKPLARDPAG